MGRWCWASLFVLAACEPVDGRVFLGGNELEAKRCEFDLRDERIVIDFELERGDRLRLVEVDRARFLVLFIDDDGRPNEEYGDCATVFVDAGRIDDDRGVVDVDLTLDCQSRVPVLLGRWRARTCDA